MIGKQSYAVGVIQLKKYETLFSIYKVDFEKVKQYFKEEQEKEIVNFEEVEENLYSDIIRKINEKEKSVCVEINQNDFRGIIFKTYHKPTWYGMAKKMVEEDKISINNSHISYIISYRKNGAMFLFTGGLGSNYINNFIQKNYGLYLLPKIIKEDSPTIKTVLENRLMGNRISDKRANKNATTINIETELSTIFRELSLEFNETLIRKLGIEIDEKKKKNFLNVIAKDSLVIRKSISLEQLKSILDTLLELEKENDNFSLGYLVSAKKYGHKFGDINELLKEYLKSNKYENFILVGGEYSAYYLNGTNYSILDEDGRIVLSKDEPITFEEIYKSYLIEPINKSRVDKFLKLILNVYDEGGLIYSSKIKDSIQGYVEDSNNNMFFLFNGEWLVFDLKYVDNLKKDYQKIYPDLITLPNNILELICNTNKGLTEDSYNETFATSENVILAHKVKSNNIEIADLIYYDEDNLYLFHNKYKFDGHGTRDVLNQILTSQEFIKNYFLVEKKQKIFGEYYQKIRAKYPNNKKIASLTKDEFINIFTKSNVYYVAGFLENLSPNTRSNYAKFITIDINKKLKENGYTLKFLDINKNFH